MVQRCVNFTLTDGNDYETPDNAPITTRNFLLRLGEDLEVRSSREILPPADMPEPQFREVVGFEDMRLFAWRDALWCIACVRELTPEGWCEQVLARIDEGGAGACRLADWRAIRPEGERLHEKNWMPRVDDERLEFIYACDPTRVVDQHGHRVTESTPAIAAEQFRGGAQAIAFDGGWLTLIHEVPNPAEPKRQYHHRFVWFDDANVLRRVSRAFHFAAKGVEFAAGLAWHPDRQRLILSYSIADRESWIATVNADEVRSIVVPLEKEQPTWRRPLERAPDTRQVPLPSIPKLFHFITGLDPNFGGKPFSFIHYMAVKSALAVNKDFIAKIYYHYEPSGDYWNLVKNIAECIKVDLPVEVFGNKVEHFAHKADVLRLQILLEKGGIYLDLDTICQRPFAPLLDGRVVMGAEELTSNDGVQVTVGLCNATIIAPPEAEFLRLWYDSYRDFTGGLSGDEWNKFSVQVPLELSKGYPQLIRVEPAASFFWPSWDSSGIAAMFLEDHDFPAAYSFHLWEGKSWSLVKDLNAEVATNNDTTYNRIARRFLEPEDTIPQAEQQFSAIYEKNTWGRGSGVGSRSDRTLEYRTFLQNFIMENQIQSVVDFGCGDWQFSRFIDWSGIDYVGLDIVESVIDDNLFRFGTNNITFRKFSSLRDLPRADLVICKDVFQHLSNSVVSGTIAAFRQLYKYALITNDEEPDYNQNQDIPIGGWRTLRLDREPFCEKGSVVFSWPVLWGAATTRKSTFLLYGEAVSNK